MIDAHHHIWRQDDLPWLKGPEQPRIFGEYGAIRRDYLIDEYLDDINGTGITKSVYVQANWHPDQAFEEAGWVQEVASQSGLPNGIVAYANFTVADVRPQLDRLAKIPLLRGIRQQMHWHENPQYRFASDAQVLVRDSVMQNVAYLADYDWSFDLQVFAPQMADAAKLADACPDVRFILQHSGMLEDLTDEGKEQWLDGIRQLVKCPNVYTKLSAFGTFIHRNDPAFVADMVSAVVAEFGAHRCMFGSNFPIEKIWTDYAKLFDGFVSATESLCEADRSAIFNDTAREVYRI